FGVCRTLVTDVLGFEALDDRRCPVSLALCAGAYWIGGRPRLVGSGGSRVHSLSLPLRFPPATGSLCRRTTGTRPVHSPLFVMWRDGGRAGPWRQAPIATPNLVQHAHLRACGA